MKTVNFFILLKLFTILHAQDLKIFSTFKSNAEFSQICALDNWDCQLLNTASSAEFLSDEEKNIILVTNMVRSNPVRFADLYIKPLFSYLHNKKINLPDGQILIISEGRALLNELYKQLIKTKSMNILYPSPGLTLAAKLHGENLQKSSKVDHGSGKNSLENRINKYGKWQYCIGENITTYYQSPMLIVISLLLDDSVKSRSHRKNILDPSFNRIGICFTNHKKFHFLSISIYACDFIEKPSY